MRATVPAVTCVLFASLAAASAAAEPTFAGAWSTDGKNCKVAQELENAPMLISPKGYDQYEAHCTFFNLTKTGNTYRAGTKCSVQGDSQTGKITIVMQNRNTLTLGIDGGPPTRMTRCR